MIRPSLVAKESIIQKIEQKESYFDHMSPCCDLDLEDSTFFPLMTLWLMMLHHHTTLLLITYTYYSDDRAERAIF